MIGFFKSLFAPAPQPKPTPEEVMLVCYECWEPGKDKSPEPALLIVPISAFPRCGRCGTDLAEAPDSVWIYP